MLVRDVMAPRVHTVTALTPFRKILRLLIKYRISGVPVVNKEKKVVGIISEKDLLRSLFPTQEEFYKDTDYYICGDIIEKEATKVNGLRAKDIMTRKVIKVSPDDHVCKACSLLVINNIRRLPVVEKGKLVGIVTTNNLYKNFVSKLVEK
jgi:CBS domain-containing protein